MTRRARQERGRVRGADYERQSAEECGLCALRNVLAPHGGAALPTWPSFVQDARALERGEEALISGEEPPTPWRPGRCRPSSCGSYAFPWLCACCSEDSDGPERADEEGNFSVEVLMRAASRQRINGQPVALEYWGGRHREAAEGREFGFILGSGEHWWCIRRSGRQLDKWEEVDSLEEQIGSTWVTDEELRSHLRSCKETVLVLYGSADAETASDSTVQECTAETDSDESMQGM